MEGAQVTSASSYIVAFRGKPEAGVYAGVIIWTTYGSREDFLTQFVGERARKYEVVEEGITPERAQELVRTTPLSTYWRIALERATIDGVVSEGRLESELEKINYIMAMRR